MNNDNINVYETTSTEILNKIAQLKEDRLKESVSGSCKYIILPQWMFNIIIKEYSSGKLNCPLYFDYGGDWSFAGMQLCPSDFIKTVDDIKVF